MKKINSVNKRYGNWTDTLFVKNAELYLPVLESCIARTPREVNGLCRIFDSFYAPKNAKILDFSCGIGRHSIYLSLKGYRVVGYDPSLLYISKAREWANEKICEISKRPKFYIGDPYKVYKVLSRNSEYNFDAVIIMDTCIGYYDRNSDLKILRDLNKIVKKNGLLILETENRDWRLANFETNVYFKNKNLEIHDAWKFNYETSVSENISRIYSIDNSKNRQLRLELQTGLRLYSLHELIDLIKESGWKYESSYNDLDTRSNFNNTCMNIVTVAKK